MATYHTEHTFAGGQPMAAWNPVTRRHESKPNPNFCAVCGRKEDHILHGAGKAVVSYGRPSHSVNPMLKTVMGISRPQGRNAPMVSLKSDR